jgi:hypothetical protein
MEFEQEVITVRLSGDGKPSTMPQTTSNEQVSQFSNQETNEGSYNPDELALKQKWEIMQQS